MGLIDLAELRLIPDVAIRFGIRRLLDQRIRLENSARTDSRDSELVEFADQLRRSPCSRHRDSMNSR